MKLMLISQFPPPSGGIATWSKAYLDYMSKKENVEISCVNCALKGERANNFNAKRNFITEIKRAISIRICVDTLSENPEYDAVYTEVDLYHLGEKIGVRNTSGSGLLWKKLLLDEGFLGTGSNIFVRRIVFKDTDVFDVRFLRYQDVEFMLRVLEKHPIIEVRECLVKKNIGSA